MSEQGNLEARLMRITFDPASYIHPCRLRLPASFNTPRHRRLINQMLLQTLPALAGCGKPDARLAWLRYWFELPTVCHFLGAQLLRNELAWRGQLLRLPAPIRAFMGLPLWPLAVAENASTQPDDAASRASFARRCAAGDPLLLIQEAGLSLLLHWQKDAPPPLLSRLRLLFPRALERCFEQPRRALLAGELFLISQAIQYAKNHSDHA